MVHAQTASSDAGTAATQEVAAHVATRAPQAWISRFDTPLPGRPGGPLAGLRFAAKDNIDAAGLPTTAACPTFSTMPAAHATVVQRLLDAGASLVGKTNLDQFACGLNGTRSPYGAVPNAFNAAYVSGGSSSGSAYVVATGEVDFALGTDTAGSGRVPAGLNNLVGLKPSKGLISAQGVVPAAQSVDCVSIFARDVATAIRVLHAAMGPDAADPYSRSLQLKTQPLPAAFRFGLPDRLDFFGDTLAAAAFEESVARLQSLGGTPVVIDYAPLAEAAAMLYESALVAERYAAIRDFFDAHEADVVEPVRSIIAQGRNYSAADLVQAQTHLQALGQRAASLWRGHAGTDGGIDVLLVPTAPTHYTIGRMQAEPVLLNRRLGAYTNFVNLLDYAALSVPSSLRPDGLPFGVTLIGPCASDLQLAALGARLQAACGLPLGATSERFEPGVLIEQALTAIQDIATASLTEPMVRVAVVGAHLSGMPLNTQLTERGATLVRATETAPDYRFYALPGTVPPKPGLVRVAAGTGACIALEVWQMPAAQYGSFVALIPAPLGIGTLTLADGSSVQGFLCEPIALDGAQDISHFGGWRAYIDVLKRRP